MNSLTSGLAAALLTLSLGGCGSPPVHPPLEGATIGGPFALTDQKGRTVRDSDFDGKYRIVYFGYSYCPDVCPTALQRVGQAVRAVEKSDPALGARLVPIFITVDPARDTPQAIGQYVANFHPRMVGLTGSDAAIASVAREYGVYYKKKPPATPGGAYLVDHVDVLYLMGPKGEPIALLPEEKGPDAIAAEIERWAR